MIRLLRAQPAGAADGAVHGGVATITDVSRTAERHLERFRNPDIHMTGTAYARSGSAGLDAAGIHIATAPDADLLVINRATGADIAGAADPYIQLRRRQRVDTEVATAGDRNRQFRHFESLCLHIRAAPNDHVERPTDDDVGHYIGAAR